MTDARYLFAVESPVGWWAVLTDDTHVLSVDHHEQLPEGMRTEPVTRLEQRLECMLSRYFKGDPVDFSTVPVAYPDKPSLVGPVMKILQEIPFGETHDYAWVAGKLGKPKAARAAGGALGRNPIPVIVPCHRIIAKHNRIGGFMQNAPEGGKIKEFLLELEGHRFLNGKRVPLLTHQG